MSNLLVKELVAGAMRLVAESFPWQKGSQFAYLRDNHNSVVGIRENALRHGASAVTVDLHPMLLDGSQSEWSASYA